MNDLILPPSVINLVWQLVESPNLPGLIFLSFFSFFLTKRSLFVVSRHGLAVIICLSSQV